MKRIFIPALIVIFTLVLAACSSGAAAPASTISNSDVYVSTNLDVSYENALAARQQLTLGSLKLAETNTPITAEQAKTMLPLWQALYNMTSSGNSASAEVNALLAQIEAAFTPDQLTAIRAMKLTSADMQAWGAANGITMGSGTGGGSGMSPEARATKQAAEGVTPGSGGTGASSALLAKLIEYLQGLAQ